MTDIGVCFLRLSNREKIGNSPTVLTAKTSAVVKNDGKNYVFIIVWTVFSLLPQLGFVSGAAPVTSAVWAGIS